MITRINHCKNIVILLAYFKKIVFKMGWSQKYVQFSKNVLSAYKSIKNLYSEQKTVTEDIGIPAVGAHPNIEKPFCALEFPGGHFLHRNGLVSVILPGSVERAGFDKEGNFNKWY